MIKAIFFFNSGHNVLMGNESLFYVIMTHIAILSTRRETVVMYESIKEYLPAVKFMRWKILSFSSLSTPGPSGSHSLVIFSP